MQEILRTPCEWFSVKIWKNYQNLLNCISNFEWLETHVFSTFSSTHRNDECVKCTRRIARLLLELDIKWHAFRSKNKMVRRTQYVHGLFYSLIGTWNANRPFICKTKSTENKNENTDECLITHDEWEQKKKKKKKQSDVEKKSVVC